MTMTVILALWTFWEIRLGQYWHVWQVGEAQGGLTFFSRDAPFSLKGDNVSLGGACCLFSILIRVLILAF
jgi:hypothetical protein